MRMTVRFVDVYDGAEHERTEVIRVKPPSDAELDSDLGDWAEE